MLTYYYKDSIKDFLKKSAETIIGTITLNNNFGNNNNEIFAWENQIRILKNTLLGKEGTILFEFSVPRMGKRIDCLLIIKDVVFVIEFKVGERDFHTHDIEQVWDYALDLKYFHKPSHDLLLVPILVATESKSDFSKIISTSHNDKLVNPLRTNAKALENTLNLVLNCFSSNQSIIDVEQYVSGSYHPTPTIIEAAISLYKNHSVAEITRSDADAVNLNKTTKYISDAIKYAKKENKKLICFVTGVPGAGKTLVGLKVATDHLDKNSGNSSVYLSGNGPLVSILQEVLTRDRVRQEKKLGNKITKKEALQSVKSFIQIIHHYRDEYLKDSSAPYDHVAIFDEAQRAWTKEQTVNFMIRKKGMQNFNYSEPEFLISCLNRHKDWAVIVCLVGGGQEINTGEAGISEWLNAIQTSFPTWETHISPHLYESEYNAIASIDQLKVKSEVIFDSCLHLAVSQRSFRAESLSNFVKQILDIDPQGALKTYTEFKDRYPIVLTRSLDVAKRWLKEKARGSERYGIVVSSQAYRLKPLAIDVRASTNPVSWFLNGKDDVRSSYFMEDIATEFQVQGLELDWACVTWDGDLRYSNKGWQTFSFVGNKWQKINKEERKKYLINAYRVLLTRARYGMIVVVPEGNSEDHTRKNEVYDSTFEYLKKIGLEILE